MKKNSELHILMNFCTDWYWFDVAKKLADQNIKIDFLISRPLEIQAAAKHSLKQTTVINQSMLEYPYLIEKLNKGNPIVLDREILNELKDCENEFLRVTDRLNFFPLPIKQRRTIYYSLVKYWLHFLKEHPLDAILFTDTPHVGYDTVLFYVAKALRIPLVSLRRPFIRDRMIFVTDYRQMLPKVPTAYQPKATLSELTALVGKDLMSDVFSENYWQKKDAVFNKAIHAKKSPFISTLIGITKSLNPVVSYGYLRSLFERSTYGGFNYNNGQTKLVEKLCGLYHRYHNHQLRKEYELLSKKINFPLRQKYIYFPLHLQPERSTTPEGGFFENQLLALDILHAALPPQWKIIVKEHPRQFGPHDFQKHIYRDKKFYQQIVGYKNVLLASMNVSQSELVNKAQMTATITGTGGWESLLVNKPTLIFGNAWYSPCQSCYIVSSVEECAIAIEQANKKSTKSVKLDLLRFLAYYQRRFVVTSNAREFAEQSTRPYELLTENMAVAIKKTLKRIA